MVPKILLLCGRGFIISPREVLELSINKKYRTVQYLNAAKRFWQGWVGYSFQKAGAKPKTVLSHQTQGWQGKQGNFSSPSPFNLSTIAISSFNATASVHYFTPLRL